MINACLDPLVGAIPFEFAHFKTYGYLNSSLSRLLEIADRETSSVCCDTTDVAAGFCLKMTNAVI